MKLFQYYLDLFINKIFDLRYGTETCEQVMPYDMETKSNNLVHALKYQGCHVRVFAKLMKQLPEEYINFNFYDFGSGKGRVLILASLHGFKSVTGIEFADDLYEQSKINWNNYIQRTGMKISSTVLNCDASDFIPMTTKNVFFFFNPFRDKVMDKVLDNIRQNSPSLADDLFIFVNPRNHFLYDLYEMRLVRTIDSSDYNRVIKFFKMV